MENSKGECNFGQHEINFRYTDSLRTADEHSIYKNAAKEIAAQKGMSISFMAKFNEREGSSCHIHFSLADGEGAIFARDRSTFESFLAGQLACLRELTLFLAPNINSYKRYAEGSFAPTAVAWGEDNRTCSLRVVGHGSSLRFENRAGGSDLNPYLALGAIIAAGLHGVDAGSSWSPHTSATRTSRTTSRACRPRCAMPASCSRQARWRERPSGTRSSITTPTPPTWSGRRSTQPSPTGSASAGSSGCEPASCPPAGRARLIRPPPSPSPRSSRSPRLRRCSRRSDRRRRSRRRSSASGRRSSSGCCPPAPAYRPSASCARSSGSHARRCARRSSRSARADICTPRADAAGARSSRIPSRPRRPPSPSAARGLARRVRRADGGRGRASPCWPPSVPSRRVLDALEELVSRSTACSRTSAPTARRTSAGTSASPRRPTALAW